MSSRQFNSVVNLMPMICHSIPQQAYEVFAVVQLLVMKQTSICQKRKYTEWQSWRSRQ